MDERRQARRVSVRRERRCLRSDHGSPRHGDHEPPGDVPALGPGGRGHHHRRHGHRGLRLPDGHTRPARQTCVLPRPHRRSRGGPSCRSHLSPEPVSGATSEVHLDCLPRPLHQPHTGGGHLELSRLRGYKSSQ